MIFNNVVYRRTASGWSEAAPIPAFYGYVVSREKPRAVYAYQGDNWLIELSTGLRPIRRERLVSETQHALTAEEVKALGVPFIPGARIGLAGDHLVGDAVIKFPSDRDERVVGRSLDGGVYEYVRESSGTWRRSLVASFVGKVNRIVVGDGRGDGVERLYALETGPTAVLWELSREPSVVIDAEDPVSEAMPKEGLRLLGDLFRSELGRHGRISVLDERSESAASAERAVAGCRGVSCSDGRRQGYRIETSVEKKGNRFVLEASLVSPDELHLLGQASSEPTRLEDLPSATLRLARRLAEEWPLARRGNAR